MSPEWAVLFLETPRSQHTTPFACTDCGRPTSWRSQWCAEHQQGKPQRDYCRQGHEMTDENRVASGIRGGSQCRTCHNLRKRERRGNQPQSERNVA